MANQALIAAKIYKGYDEAAKRLGAECSIYRATSAIDPISPPFLIGTVFVSPTKNWNYMTVDKFGDSAWTMIVDGRVIEKNDYLVCPLGTYYITDKQPIQPLLGIQTNLTIDIERPQMEAGPGDISYGGYVKGTGLEIARNLPASILQGGRGAVNKINLPTDDRFAGWRILMPDVGGLNILDGDLITDSRGKRYVVYSSELSTLGWRLSARELGS